jgi:hypothetical protein
MTGLAVVGRIADRGRDGVHHGERLVRVVPCPDSDQDRDYPKSELAPESAALAVVSAATSHAPVSLRAGERFVISAHISRKPAAHYWHNALSVHSQCIPQLHSALWVHFAYQ